MAEMWLRQNLSFQVQVGNSLSPCPFPSLPPCLDVSNISGNRVFRSKFPILFHFSTYEPPPSGGMETSSVSALFVAAGYGTFLGGRNVDLTSRVKLVLNSELPFTKMQLY